MAIQSEELEHALNCIGSKGAPWFKEFLLRLSEYIGDELSICFRVHNPRISRNEDTTGITDKTILVLWGDERSVHLPKKYFAAARNIVKYHLPEAWMRKGFIPMTDTVFVNPPETQLSSLLPCSQRLYSVFYSGNFNYRRLDLYRGLAGSSFGVPFRMLACYPVNGIQPLWHKISAAVLQKVIEHTSKKRDFSNLFPDSYVAFTNGFGKGLSADEYTSRLCNSKISICPPGFVTNETIRLMESCLCGAVVVCGELPKLPMYEGHPFVEMRDWRRIRWVVDDLLSNPDQLDEMGKACKKWYHTHFSPDAQARRIANNILGGRIF